MYWQERYKSKCVDPLDLEEWAAQRRKEGQSIATLNGSFDLLHAGHLQILYEASLQADCLIVALNSDESIKAYKGSDRPIIPLEYRLQMMAAIEFVDYVTFFHETTPINFLKKVRPDVHINGSEYGSECIEADTVREGGGKLYLVERIEGLSTSKVIENAARCYV